MKDRRPTKVLENGALRYGIYDEETGELLQYVYMRAEDEPTQVGTPLTKAALLSDDTARILGLEQEDPTVSEALAALGAGKQESLEGKEGQFLGFGADGKPEAQALPETGVGRSVAGKKVQPVEETTVTAGTGAEIFNDYRERTFGTDEGYEDVIAWTGNIASGIRSHAEGECSTASGQGAHAEGHVTVASGRNSHAEGGRFTGQVGCVASGYGSHAEGVSTTASGNGSHSEGRGTTAPGEGSHSEGYSTAASGPRAHAEGWSTIAEGYNSHTEGNTTKATADNTHAEGYHTTASKSQAHAEGSTTQATGQNSHAEGYAGIAEGSASHVEGGQMVGEAVNKASGYAAHAEGASTLASGGQSHAEGCLTTASATNSHAEGYNTTASALGSHAEGTLTKATADYAHAEGTSTLASAASAHAEGIRTAAAGESSHAEGGFSSAQGTRSHAEGDNTIASGSAAHAEGLQTESRGAYSHAGGSNTVANCIAETAIGQYNVISSTSSSNYLVVGKGSSAARANAFRVSYSGVYGTSSFNASGADYAERFEWADGNPDGEDRAGLFVTLAGPHIRVAGPEDGYLLGIVSGSPSIVGDVYDDQWKGMYLTDVFGRPLWEEVEVPAVTEEHDILEMADTGRTDEAGNPIFEEIRQKETVVLIPAHTERRQKLNPAYDPAQTYIPQSERPEKENVGLLGKLVALEDGSCQVDGWCTAGEGGRATFGAERTRFRVMEKLTDPDTGRKCVRVMILPGA